jgi:DNA primase
VARIKPESVEAVKAAADMVEVVGARTQLRKAGARYTGRCPFHEERTPSFSVNPVEKLYYCFGCGAGGDLITFVKETENVDFAGAVESLADRFRVELEYEETSPAADRARERRDRLGKLLEQAASFYERCLWDTAGAAPAREYLAGRGLGEEVCRTFRLGFAPGGQTLAKKAHEGGFSGEELLAAGLVNRRGSDYFSQRIVFPLADARGRVLGFQARKLREDDPLQAKYVNSPESDLFRKGDVLYGLDLARAAIARQDRAVVVEGNTDVIALRQEGLEPVVAAMGTALTDRHLRQLQRLTRHLWLCFDGDAAGEAATLRGMELAAEQGFVIKVVTLPPGSDPADLAAGFEQQLTTAQPYLVHRVRLEIDRAADRQEAFVRVREILNRFEDSPERQDAMRLAADRLDLPPELQAGLAPRTRAATGTLSDKVLQAGDRLERDAMAGCLAHPGLQASLAELEPEAFDSEQHRALREHLIRGGEVPGELVGLVAELDARAAAEHIDERTAKELLLRLTERDLRRQLARTNGDLSKTIELQEKLERVRSALDALS